MKAITVEPKGQVKFFFMNQLAQAPPGWAERLGVISLGSGCRI